MLPQKLRDVLTDAFWFLLLLIGAVFLSVRAFGKEPKAYVPLNCLHNITILDFHKPCKLDPHNPNMAHCDDVVIRFACIEYKGE